jgi:hypothetical protein
MGNTKRCPNCFLLNPKTQEKCDCGYNFLTRTGPKKQRDVAESNFLIYFYIALFWLWPIKLAIFIYLLLLIIVFLYVPWSIIQTEHGYIKHVFINYGFVFNSPYYGAVIDFSRLFIEITLLTIILAFVIVFFWNWKSH